MSVRLFQMSTHLFLLYMLNRLLFKLTSFYSPWQNITDSPESDLGRAASPSLTQRMDSFVACVTSCAMHTANESSHSAAGTLHHIAVPHVRITMRCSIHSPQKKFASSRSESPTNPKKSSSGQPDPPPQTT